MNKKRDLELIHSRCSLLKSLGFEICHEDSRVRVEVDEHIRDIEIDFSKIDSKNFLKFALQEAYKAGKVTGRNEIRKNVKNLLESEEDPYQVFY